MDNLGDFGHLNNNQMCMKWSVIFQRTWVLHGGAALQVVIEVLRVRIRRSFLKATMGARGKSKGITITYAVAVPSEALGMTS
jgi:hypothetical protein